MLVRASKYCKITKKEANALIKVYEWSLLHENTPQSINRVINGLKEKVEIRKNDEELCKTINLVSKRINIYNTHIYEKKDTYLKVINERNNDAVSITFPSTC